jgi:hypothetical protein
VSTGMHPGKDHFKWVEFLADLVVLKSKGIDVILGMDWLSQHHGLIRCADKVVGDSPEGPLKIRGNPA